MEERDVRSRADALCAALVAGDMEQVTADVSKELRQNLGEVIALLPLPSTAASVESIERAGSSGYVVNLRLVGESDEVVIQTRWKERDDKPTIIEASHLSRVEATPSSDDAEGEPADEHATA